jgi:anti-sigma factor RsiW
MNCQEARELLLVADSAELVPAEGSPLGVHLRECAECRGRAATIQATEAALRERLATALPRRGVQEARRRSAGRAVRARRLRLFVPLAAAAGIVAVVLGWPRALPPGPGVMPAPRAPFSVTAPPGRSVAVVRTDNPDVVVFWFF